MWVLARGSDVFGFVCRVGGGFGSHSFDVGDHIGFEQHVEQSVDHGFEIGDDAVWQVFVDAEEESAVGAVGFGRIDSLVMRCCCQTSIHEIERVIFQQSIKPGMRPFALVEQLVELDVLRCELVDVFGVGFLLDLAGGDTAPLLVRNDGPLDGHVLVVRVVSFGKVVEEHG